LIKNKLGFRKCQTRDNPLSGDVAGQSLEEGKVRDISLMYAALLALVALLAIPAGAAGDPDAVLGIWETAGDDRAHIES
jgi:hypothetical protein